MKPKISFVIPVYDGDAYLAETLDSIRNQTMKEIEIIVVDDCSPDYTEELMNYYKMDERIKYYKLEQNKGVCEARNFGNQMAEADLICVSDQDDLSMPIRAEESYKFMIENPSVNCLTSDYWELNVDGQQEKEWANIPDMTRELFEKNEFVWFHSSACYRKEDILNLPYRQEPGKTDDWVFLDDWTRAGMIFMTSRTIFANCRRVPWGQMQIRRQSQGLQPSYIL